MCFANKSLKLLGTRGVVVSWYSIFCRKHVHPSLQKGKVLTAAHQEEQYRHLLFKLKLYTVRLSCNLVSDQICIT